MQSDAAWQRLPHRRWTQPTWPHVNAAAPGQAGYLLINRFNSPVGRTWESLVLLIQLQRRLQAALNAIRAQVQAHLRRRACRPTGSRVNALAVCTAADDLTLSSASS